VAERRVPTGLPGVGSAPQVLTLTKVRERSTVHRAAPLDFVGVTRFDEQGRAVGEERFFGLYTAGVYSASANDLPVVRRKVAQVMARAGFPAMSHDDRTLANVLETLPRDEMLRWTTDELYAIALRVMHIGERRRVRVISSVDPWGRFVSLLVYIPRDRYTTPVRVGVLDALQRACDGTRVDFSVLLTESVLGRLHVVVQTRAPVALDDRVLEAELTSIARAWTDDLRDALVAARGEEAGLDAYRVWGDAFPVAYQGDVTATDAVADIAVLEARDDVAIRLVGDGAGAGRARLELFRTGSPVVLSDVMPVLEHLGVTVVDERPYPITPHGAPPGWIYSFGVRAPDDALHDGGAPARVAELFLGVWAGEIENDALNRLVVRAGLTAAQVVVLRALVKYLHQAGARFTEASFADTLAAHPRATKLLVALFEARFDPSVAELDRADSERRLSDELGLEIDAVQSLEEDRILRMLLETIRALVRTNAYTTNGDTYLSLKLDPARLSFLPAPRPQHEI
jgi:glutamate dehydrogenase